MRTPGTATVIQGVLIRKEILNALGNFRNPPDPVTPRFQPPHRGQPHPYIAGGCARDSRHQPCHRPPRCLTAADLEQERFRIKSHENPMIGLARLRSLAGEPAICILLFALLFNVLRFSLVA